MSVALNAGALLSCTLRLSMCWHPVSGMVKAKLAATSSNRPELRNDILVLLMIVRFLLHSKRIAPPDHRAIAWRRATPQRRASDSATLGCGLCHRVDRVCSLFLFCRVSYLLASAGRQIPGEKTTARNSRNTSSLRSNAVRRGIPDRRRLVFDS